MVKKSNNNAKTRGSRAAPPQKKKMRTQSVPRSMGLDAGAAAYAALLADPCNAALAHPTYYGSTGGYVGRFVTEWASVASSDTYFNVFWAPSVMNSASSGMAISTTGNAGVVTSINTPASRVPGFSFLTGSLVAKYRCVAACIEIFWNDTEFNRAGVVHVGNGPVVSLGATITGDALATQLPYMERMPSRCVTLKFRPGQADGVFRDPSLPQTDDAQQCTNMMASVVLPAGAADRVRFRFTGVYEWVPEFNSGLSVPTSSTNKSRHSLGDVINTLDSAGEWMYKAGNAVGKAAAGAYRLFGQGVPFARNVMRAAPLMLM